MAKPKQPPTVTAKSPATGLGVVKRPPNKLPNSNHIPVTGKSE
jgi:hypothetical protein